MNTISFDIDVSKIENATLYAVAVPVNAQDYPNDVIFSMKYNSIHLSNTKLSTAPQDLQALLLFLHA